MVVWGMLYVDIYLLHAALVDSTRQGTSINIAENCMTVIFLDYYF